MSELQGWRSAGRAAGELASLGRDGGVGAGTELDADAKGVLRASHREQAIWQVGLSHTPAARRSERLTILARGLPEHRLRDLVLQGCAGVRQPRDPAGAGQGGRYGEDEKC